MVAPQYAHHTTIVLQSFGIRCYPLLSVVIRSDRIGLNWIGLDWSGRLTYHDGHREDLLGCHTAREGVDRRIVDTLGHAVVHQGYGVRGGRGNVKTKLNLIKFTSAGVGD